MFDSHVKSLCKKASQKLNTLSRVAYQLDFNQRKLLMNAFITSQFSYAPVVWMFHSRKQNHHINRIHERALRVAYKDYNSSFDELFEKDNSCNNGSKIGFLKTSLANFVKLTSNELVTNCQIKYVFFIVTIRFRSGSTCPVTPGIGVFKAIVNDWYLLTMCRRNFIPGVPGVLTIFSGWIFVMSMC